MSRPRLSHMRMHGHCIFFFDVLDFGQHSRTYKGTSSSAESSCSDVLGFVTGFLQVANWLSQETYYNYSSPTPWTTNSPNFFKWRFFTQMVWQNTTAVGCGTANANATSDIFGPGSCQVLLCKYDAPGNTPQTDAAFADNVVPYVDPGSLNYTVANSSCETHACTHTHTHTGTRTNTCTHMRTQYT